jgi:hypothetical protein
MQILYGMDGPHEFVGQIQTLVAKGSQGSRCPPPSESTSDDSLRNGLIELLQHPESPGALRRAFGWDQSASELPVASFLPSIIR